MKRSPEWRSAVDGLAEAYFKNPDPMVMLYAGGPVTPKHLYEYFRHRERNVQPIFGREQPTRQQLMAMARDINAKSPGVGAHTGTGLNTGMAAEFHVLSCLNRLGISASLTLGNTKAVDIVVTLPDLSSATIDVKGLAGNTGWPIDNVKVSSVRHFLVFVCFRDLIDDLWEAPEVFVVPSTDIEGLMYKAPGGRRLMKAVTLRQKWQFYEHAWHRISQLTGLSPR